jgi:hypothetical protein
MIMEHDNIESRFWQLLSNLYQISSSISWTCVSPQLCIRRVKILVVHSSRGIKEHANRFNFSQCPSSIQSDFPLSFALSFSVEQVIAMSILHDSASFDSCCSSADSTYERMRDDKSDNGDNTHETPEEVEAASFL